MEKSKIIESLKSYFESDFTDFAVMVTGEWGIGKTHFLTQELFPKLKLLKLRPIYISLIGLNNDLQLEKLIFQKINPFYSSYNRSAIAKEADYIESIVNNTKRPDINIPENLVLCFDDLERIKPEFLESAMGFINVFLEHYKTKCLFICNEKVLEKNDNFSSYKIVKEKYIRFTYSFSPVLGEVLKDKLPEINSAHLSYFDETIIVEMFKRGNTYNLRTLFFIISIYEQCLNVLDKDPSFNSYQDRIISLILTYCCFYTIEIKKGTPHELLDKITIALNKDILFNWMNDKEIIESIDEDLEQEDKKASGDFSDKLESIQQSYFYDDYIQFERFLSIAGLIKSGYLDTIMLKNEVYSLIKALKKKEKRNNESRIVSLLENVFDLSDSELNQKIEIITEEVKKGTFNLTTYLRLYQRLIWLESLRIKDIRVNEEVTLKFKEGVKKASKSGELDYIENLHFQIQWSKEDKSEYAKRYNQFADYVSKINESLNEAKEFKDLYTAIVQNNHDEIFNLLNKESDIRLIKKNAKEIYDILIHANAATTNNFLNAIEKRYADDGSIISQLLSLEKDFINSLYELLISDNNLNLETEKPLSKVPLMFLKNHLRILMKSPFPDDKINQNEE
ncbi:P-loop NTPase fold protein [Saccharicrinis sp. FJH54]|uniref:P-loop NTPase fold protein n=1 Tax=Saccharicrinis sp. FJH54 TaxID=3344665 RepID=UPI0035D49063